MNTYRFVRTDMYFVDVDAKSLKEARKIVDERDGYLHGGSYCGSEFTLEEEYESD